LAFKGFRNACVVSCLCAGSFSFSERIPGCHQGETQTHEERSSGKSDASGKGTLRRRWLPYGAKVNPQDVIERYVFSLMGKPYLYGKEGPSGYDCSGLVKEILKASGLSFPHDMTAQQIFEYLKGLPGTEWNQKKFGAIAFFGNSTGSITHTGFMLNAVQMLEAGGGNSLTRTKEDADLRGAQVRIRALATRKDLVLTLRPAYPWF